MSYEGISVLNLFGIFFLFHAASAAYSLAQVWDAPFSAIKQHYDLHNREFYKRANKAWTVVKYKHKDVKDITKQAASVIEQYFAKPIEFEKSEEKAHHILQMALDRPHRAYQILMT